MGDGVEYEYSLKITTCPTYTIDVDRPTEFITLLISGDGVEYTYSLILKLPRFVHSVTGDDEYEYSLLLNLSSYSMYFHVRMMVTNIHQNYHTVVTFGRSWRRLWISTKINFTCIFTLVIMSSSFLFFRFVFFLIINIFYETPYTFLTTTSFKCDCIFITRILKPSCCFTTSVCFVFFDISRFIFQ